MTTILAVDDHPRILKMLTRNLAGDEQQVLLAKNGIEALSILEEIQVEIVLLDQQMPEMDGVETMKKIALLSPPPKVIMMTAQDSSHVAVEFMKAGGTDFILKPIDFDVLNVKIQKIVERISRQRSMEGTLLQKDQFLTAVSHKLKTPLGYLIPTVELLLEDVKGEMKDLEVEQSVLDALKILDDGMKDLYQIAEEMLNFSKLSRGKALFQPVSISFNDFFYETMFKQCRILMEASKCLFRVDIPPDLPPIMADPPKLQQILFSLLENAIQYSQEEGQIDLRVKNGKRGLDIEIKDQGVGIDEKNQETIFESFQQIREPEDFQEGLGLGLSVVKILVALHGGEIEVNSELGKGSVFTFFLPFA